VVLLLDTGARYSEIANITWDRIDLEEKVIHLWRPKVRNESIIYMTGRVLDILKRRSETKAGDHVSTSSKGGARGYTSKGIFRAFERAGLSDCLLLYLPHPAAAINESLIGNSRPSIEMFCMRLRRQRCRRNNPSTAPLSWTPCRKTGVHEAVQSCIAAARLQ
jgi:hypothetical protein